MNGQTSTQHLWECTEDCLYHLTSTAGGTLWEYFSKELLWSSQKLKALHARLCFLRFVFADTWSEGRRSLSSHKEKDPGSRARLQSLAPLSMDTLETSDVSLIP